MKTLLYTDFSFKKQTKKYTGKVRDVYYIESQFIIMISTDRISAFDVVLPKGIPYKGQVLNQLSSKFLDKTTDIVPNWKIASPDPVVTVGYNCTPFPVEMIVRGYLSGSAWRDYKQGKRSICGVSIPNNMRENQKFDQPIITPTTKAEQGLHDENITRDEILKRGIICEKDYMLLEKYALDLFNRGSEIAKERGLILVDTKYEFGKRNGQIYLIDEIHTPDSSRYFYADSYNVNFDKGLPQHQLSKEFVREWLMNSGFQGKEGQVIPEMKDDIVKNISDRYIELYEKLTGEIFVKAQDYKDTYLRIETNIDNMLARLL